jgi:hypothetical protein
MLVTSLMRGVINPAPLGRGGVMRLIRPFVVSCTLLLACARLLYGQGTDCLEHTFIANVTDHGLQPAELTKDNFQVTYHGHNLIPRNVYYT